MDLDKLEELARAATPERWVFEIGNRSKSEPRQIRDADFISAASPAVVLELLARLRAAETAKAIAEEKAKWEVGMRLLAERERDATESIVRDLAASDPTYEVDMGMGQRERGCRWCITLLPKSAADHKPHCLWRRAVESKP